MKRAALLATLVTACLLAEGAGAEDEIVARLVTRMGDVDRSPLVSLKPSPDAPDGLVVPKDLADARWVRRKLGSERILLVAARFRPEPAWIRVDLNFDGDLADDAPIPLTGSGSVRQARVNVTVPLSPADPPVELTLRFVHHASPTSHCLHLGVPVQREGEVAIGGRVRRLLLIDGDGDLVFTTPGQDRILLDVDGDLEISTRSPSHEEVRAGQPFRLGEGGWVARVTKGGDLAFRRTEVLPDRTTRPWPRSGTPKSGVDPTGRVMPLRSLLNAYRKAEATDRKAGPNVTTERRKLLTDIGRTGKKEAFNFLLNLSRTDPDLNVKSSALRATGYRCYRPFAPQVFEIARSGGSPAVRMAAFASLHGMAAPDRVALFLEVVRETNEASLFGNAARYLAYANSAEGLELLTKLALEHPKEDFRYQAYDVATRYRPDAPPAAMVLAAARAGHVRLKALGLTHAFILGLPEAGEIARASLSHGDEKVKLAAVRIIATGGVSEAVGSLLSAMPTLPAAVRTEAIRLLRPIRRTETIEVICDRLSADSPAIRALAADVLAGIPGEMSVRALLDRLPKEKDPRALAALLRAMVAHRPPGADAKIISAAEGAKSDPDAFAAALDALAGLGLEQVKVRRFFEKALRSRLARVRVVALDAASRAGA